MSEEDMLIKHTVSEIVRLSELHGISTKEMFERIFSYHDWLKQNSYIV